MKEPGTISLLMYMSKCSEMDSNTEEHKIYIEDEKNAALFVFFVTKNQ